jgi:hypothetical protein
MRVDGLLRCLSRLFPDLNIPDHRFSLAAFFSSLASLRKPKRGLVRVLSSSQSLFLFLFHCASILELPRHLLKIPPSFIFLFCPRFHLHALKDFLILYWTDVSIPSMTIITHAIKTRLDFKARTLIRSGIQCTKSLSQSHSPLYLATGCDVTQRSGSLCISLTNAVEPDHKNITHAVRLNESE